MTQFCIKPSLNNDYGDDIMKSVEKSASSPFVALGVTKFDQTTYWIVENRRDILALIRRGDKACICRAQQRAQKHSDNSPHYALSQTLSWMH